MLAPFDKHVIRRIKAYQNNQYVHQLTCGNNSLHVLDANEEGLFCPNCDYKQNWVPDEVITTRANILDLREKLEGKKYLIVGDIHGCFNQTIDLIAETKPDFIISCGDLMDRGPASHQVLNLFYGQREKAFVVEGNHDNKFKRWCYGNKVKLTNGLNKTIEQVEKAGLDKEKMAKWITDWPNIIRVPDIDGKPTYVVHAGIDGRYPIEKQTQETTMYIRGTNPKNYFDETGGIWYDTVPNAINIICGHIVEENWRPRENIYALDGGCVKGGVLRGMLFKDGKHILVEIPGEKHDESE